MVLECRKEMTALSSLHKWHLDYSPNMTVQHTKRCVHQVRGSSRLLCIPCRILIAYVAFFLADKAITKSASEHIMYHMNSAPWSSRLFSFRAGVSEPLLSMINNMPSPGRVAMFHGQGSLEIITFFSAEVCSIYLVYHDSHQRSTWQTLANLRKAPSLFHHMREWRTCLTLDCTLCSNVVPSLPFLLCFLLSWKYKLWQCDLQPLQCVICTLCMHACIYVL